MVYRLNEFQTFQHAFTSAGMLYVFCIRVLYVVGKYFFYLYENAILIMF